MTSRAATARAIRSAVVTLTGRPVAAEDAVATAKLAVRPAQSGEPRLPCQAAGATDTSRVTAHGIAVVLARIPLVALGVDAGGGIEAAHGVECGADRCRRS